jgi:hypothetical protein
MVDYNIQSMEGAPLVAKNDYTAYVEYVENVLGGRREQITLDENYTKIVVLTDVLGGATGNFIDIRCPAGQKFSIMGTQQIPRGADARTAHSFRVRLANSADTEIGLYNKIRITKEGITDSVTNIARVFYADVSLVKQLALAGETNEQLKTDLEWYRWKQGIELNGEQHLIISAINLAAADLIDDDHTRFAIDVDIWYF